MDGHVRANQAKPSGIAHKELVCKNHLFPALGNKRLDDITDEDVQQLKFTLRHRKPTTVNNVLSVLSMMLKKVGVDRCGSVDSRRLVQTRSSGTPRTPSLCPASRT
jgi:hypothetical protein